MGPLRAGQELRRFQRVGLMAVKPATCSDRQVTAPLGLKVLRPRLELPEA